MKQPVSNLDSLDLYTKDENTEKMAHAVILPTSLTTVKKHYTMPSSDRWPTYDESHRNDGVRRWISQGLYVKRTSFWEHYIGQISFISLGTGSARKFIRERQRGDFYFERLHCHLPLSLYLAASCRGLHHPVRSPAQNWWVSSSRRPP